MACERSKLYWSLSLSSFLLCPSLFSFFSYILSLSLCLLVFFMLVWRNEIFYNNFRFQNSASSSFCELPFDIYIFLFFILITFFTKKFCFHFRTFFHQIIIVVVGHCYQHYFQYQYHFISIINCTIFDLIWISSFESCIIVSFNTRFLFVYFLFYFYFYFIF